MSANRIGKPGIATPFLKDIQVRENTRTGQETTRVYEGSYSEVLAWRNLVRSGGASEILFGPLGDGNWRVEYVYPYGENGFDVYAPSIYELEVQTSQLPWYLNPKVRANISEANIQAILRVGRDYQSGVYPKTAGDTPEADAETDLNALTGSDATALKLFKRVFYQGADAPITYSNVLRRTLTAATPLQVRASYVGAGKIWTTAEVQAYENIDPTGWFQLDLGMQWLKSRPQVLAVAGQKTQVIYSYTEFWAATVLYYDAYGTAVLLDV